MGDIAVKKDDEVWVRWFFSGMWSRMERVKENEVDSFIKATCRRYGVKFNDYATFEVIDGPTLLVLPASEIHSFSLVARTRKMFNGVESHVGIRDPNAVHSSNTGV